MRGPVGVETDHTGAVPADAIAAYRAVAARYPVVGGHLTTEHATIVVAEGMDLAAADALARDAAPGLGDALRVAVDGA